MITIVPAIDEPLGSTRLAALSLPPVLIRHAGAIAGPLIVSWVLKRVLKQLGERFNADLFAGGIGHSAQDACHLQGARGQGRTSVSKRVTVEAALDAESCSARAQSTWCS
jgi:hypothetical protein